MITINNAKYIDEYNILVEFSDGNSHIIDLTDLKLKPGLFAEFSDVNIFRDFEVDEELGTIKWHNGLDISPESLFTRATGIKPKWAI